MMYEDYEDLVERLRGCIAEQNGEKTLWCQAADAIDNLLYICKHQAEELRNIPKWISVAERLPEDHELVLTCDDRQNIHMMSHTKKYKYPFGISPNNPRYFMVKYWMPLPEPPKDGE